jgi:hypothetical protein
MTQATITAVSEKPRPWGEKYPGSVSVKIYFADGSEGEVGTKEQYAAGHIEALKKLLGKPSEFELEARGEYQGVPQFKVKNYEGKPGSERGKRDYVPRYTDTPDGFHENDERVDRRKALELAVGWVDVENLQQSLDKIATTANAFYAWLRESVSGGPPAKASVSAAGASEDPYKGLALKVDAQGPPSDTISGEDTHTLHSTEGASSDDRREGDAGDSGAGADTPDGAVTPHEAAQTPGSPSRRQRCFHAEGVKVITKESGGEVTVCIRCGVVISA